ncbi:MAG: pyridoxamine kinase [Clostridia bacterium]|nr:pyridoxamine kinase [Clostridia bacterium]
MDQYKRILTVQDISCVGQCSLTVALPILSACGIETAILPSAVLSTHTGGFKGFTFRDLTSDIPAIIDHWKREGISFDAVYTGYLGSAEQIELVLRIFKELLREGGKRIVDPAMADNGVLYSIFDDAFVAEMRKLTSNCDVVLPNITEACFLTGTEYKERYDEKYISDIIGKLRAAGAGTVVLTGVSYDDETTGVAVFENGEEKYYRHEKMPRGCHGTGDVVASAFSGMYVRGMSAYEAAKIAADYTLHCIKYTQGDADHWYGVKFEPLLSELTDRVK